MRAPRCDIFCTVIDNFGDLGVCWRLARQLAQEHHVRVTLWVDDLTSFKRLAPSLNDQLSEQPLGDITVRHWSANIGHPQPAEWVIEGFGCHLPEHYVNAMAKQSPTPVWVNLEYLSAESWVHDCHGMTSVHPQLGLVKTFWFPGFSEHTGGLLREQDLIQRLTQTAHNPERSISLFSYDNAAIPDLLDALTADEQHTTLYVFTGHSLPAVSSWAGQTLQPNAHYTRGTLSIQVLPLLDHKQFDALLARCDLNLVRGEDSFVRAQWAAKPMLWHIYPQAELAHADKLMAFMQTLEAHCDMPAIWQQAMLSWNQLAGTASMDWATFLHQLPSMQKAMETWRHHLLQQTDLATQLMRFYTNQVESSPNSVHTGKHTS